MVCRLYFTMEFLPIYGLAYSSVKVADYDRARGLMVAIYAVLLQTVQRHGIAVFLIRDM